MDSSCRAHKQIRLLLQRLDCLLVYNRYDFVVASWVRELYVGMKTKTQRKSTEMDSPSVCNSQSMFVNLTFEIFYV